MSYESIKLNKGMYYAKDKKFTEILEELDPSENYKGTNLEGSTAYQRQLKRFDIKVNGPHCDSIRKFFQSTETQLLFPALIEQKAEKSMKKESIIEKVVNTTVRINSQTFTTYDFSESHKENEPKLVKEGSALPEFNVKPKKQEVSLTKFGFVFQESYEATLNKKIDVIDIVIEQMMKSIKKAQTINLIKLIVEGDGNKNPAKTINAKENGKLSYSDVISPIYYAEDCIPDVMLLSNKVFYNILELEETRRNSTPIVTFKDNVPTIAGLEVVVSPYIAEDMIIYVNKTRSIQKLCAKDMTVEHGKNIEKQLLQFSIYEISTFLKMASNGCYVLKIKK